MSSRHTLLLSAMVLLCSISISASAMAWSGVSSNSSASNPPSCTGKLTGRVTDSEGHPIPGVEVSATRFGNGGCPASPYAAVTDSEGRYEIVNLGTTTNYLWIVSSHYLTETFNNIPCQPHSCSGGFGSPPGTGVGVIDGETTSGIDFRLERPARIEIVNADPGGTQLRVFSKHGWDVGAGRSLWPGTYFALAIHTDGVDELYGGIPCPGYLSGGLGCDPTSGTPLVLGAGETRSLSMPPTAGGSILGRVTETATGLPLPGIVKVWDSEGRLVGSAEGESYRVAHLPAGDYYVTAHSPLDSATTYVTALYPDLLCPLGPPLGCDPTDGVAVTISNQESVEGIDLSLSAGGSLVATVVDEETDRNLYSISIDLLDQDGRLVSTTDHQDDHEYSLEGIQPGSYYVVTRTPVSMIYGTGYFDETHENQRCNRYLTSDCDLSTTSPLSIQADGSTRVDFKLTPYGGISGTYRGEAYQRISAWDLEGRKVGETGVASEGEYELRMLPPGSYRVFAGPSHSSGSIDELYNNIECLGGLGVGCELSDGEIVQFAPGQVQTGIDFDLESGGAIVGSVRLAATQQDFDHFKVRVYDSRGNLVQSESNTDATFRVGGLTSGSYFVEVTPWNTALLKSLYGFGSCGACDPLDGEPVEVTTGEDTLGIDFDLESKVNFCSRPQVACLLDNRFLIEGTMADFESPPNEHPISVMRFPSGRAESDQAVFFESFKSGNFELAVKMVDGCTLPPNNPLHSYWVFVGGLTNAESEILIEDSATNETLIWHNPRGEFPKTYANVGAFPCTSGTPSCSRSGESACLLSDRFRVSGFMLDFDDPPHQYPAKVMTFPEPKAVTDQAAFFESFSEGNFELGVKLVDGCDLPQDHPQRGYWVFFGGLTNAGTNLSVTKLNLGPSDRWTVEAGDLPQSEGRVPGFRCP